MFYLSSDLCFLRLIFVKIRVIAISLVKKNQIMFALIALPYKYCVNICRVADPQISPGSV